MSEQVRLGVRARLTGPGGPFEIVEEDVLGERMRVFKNRPRSLRDLLRASAAHGDKEYLVHDARRITYAQHLAHVASVAAALRERYGIARGDRVAILAANCAEWPLAFWATVSLGGIVAALNGWWTPDEIAYGVSDSAPKLLIGDRARLARARGLGLEIPVVEIESQFEELLRHAPGAALPEEPIAEDDAAVILYTSGTTGRPKGAVGSHRGIAGFVSTATYSGAENAVTDMTLAGGGAPAAAPKQGVTLAMSPMFHLSGLYATIVLQLALGGKLVMRSGRFDEAETIRLMARERVTTFAALGSMGPRIARHPELARHDLSCVENVGFGGAPVSPAVQELLRAAFPNASSQQGIGYGSSESVSAPTTIRGAEYVRHPTSAGRVIPTHELEIRDEHGKALPEGVEGEIHIRSPYLMLGYWGKPDATAKTIKPGRWLATGDIGRFENGLLYINSRARDMILRNAENVYPVEIEYRLEQHALVREAAVFGVDHEEWGQAVKAVVVPEADATLDSAELARWCGETLAAYKVPTAWEVRSEPLPRNPSGKVLKDVLRGGTNSFMEG
ncbi:MAG: acyl--CoA ligase [Deltaproteobacteria bacterium]|nr:acyl--CoA ligase [Deltaproteobacteria bacterium]